MEPKPNFLEQCPSAMSSPYGCHTLNFCGADSAECITHAVSFVGTVQDI